MLKSTWMMVSAAALTALVATPALAEDSGPSAYVGAGGGVNFLRDMDFTGGNQVKTKTGWAAIGTIGYRWGNGLRTEIEGGYRENKANFYSSTTTTNTVFVEIDERLVGITTTTITPTKTKGKVTAESLMFNALYDFDTNSNFTPYIGGGIGIARPEFKFSPYKSHDGSFAYQGIAGVSLKLNDSLDAFADYRYFATSGMDVTLNGQSNRDQYRAHTVLVGLRWTFWRPAPPPVEVAAPAALPAPKDYTIYFQFDKSNITPEAGAVLDEIKTSTQPAQTLSVVAHTDSSGSNAYNDALSERRAKSTTEGLTSRGLKVTSEEGHGENELAVATGDGVKEPLNRRAVIKVNP